MIARHTKIIAILRETHTPEAVRPLYRLGAILLLNVPQLKQPKDYVDWNQCFKHSPICFHTKTLNWMMRKNTPGILQGVYEKMYFLPFFAKQSKQDRDPEYTSNPSWYVISCSSSCTPAMLPPVFQRSLLSSHNTLFLMWNASSSEAE